MQYNLVSFSTIVIFFVWKNIFFKDLNKKGLTFLWKLPVWEYTILKISGTGLVKWFGGILFRNY